MPISFLFYITFKGAYAVAARGFGAHPRGISLKETNETEEGCIACLPLFLFYLCYCPITHLLILLGPVAAHTVTGKKSQKSHNFY